MKRFLFGVLCLALCCNLFSPLPAQAGESDGLTVTPARFKVTFETLELPGDEDMGLLGGSFLFDTTDWLSVGGSVYGATTGDRGGFITLGLTGEVRKELTRNSEINAGMFVGAGGGRGGSTLQGGGLMLRYHLGGQWNTKRLGSFGAGLSYVDLPNGNIDSLQPYLTYEYPFNTLLNPGWLITPEKTERTAISLPKLEHEFAIVYHYYDIPSEVRTDSGNPQHSSLELVGVEWQRYLNDTFFYKIESAGAMGGESNGYMQVLLGPGVRMKLGKSTALKLSATVGVAGGGSVATGGGLLVDATVALQQKLWKNWYAEVAGGYVNAPDGDFEAASLSAKLGHSFETPQAPGDNISLSNLKGFTSQHLRARITHQSYFEAASGWRNHHVDEDVQLLGIQLDSFLNDYLYLTGQGIAAYEGNAGGYMTGLIGSGLHLPLFNSPLFLELEGLVGAAGGGGLDVAGGFVWQGNAGVGYELSDTCSLIASYGYMSAPQGNFRADTLSLSLAYRFSMFTAE